MNFWRIERKDHTERKEQTASVGEFERSGSQKTGIRGQNAVFLSLGGKRGENPLTVERKKIKMTAVCFGAQAALPLRPVL
ncbi:MAG: hypothetical protein LUC30_05770 [Clostridiales bacterium]|nr:hypothetical protein [Clostridiales bacterium]